MRFGFLMARAFAAAAFALLAAAPAPRAVETVTVGAVGAASAAPWAIYIGMDEGFFEKRGLKLDVIYAPSVGSLIQQVTAGSLDIVASAGLVDPTFAVARGASLAIVRVEGQVAPYALVGKGTLKSLKDLKGKTISIDETTGITRTYLERMLEPNGLKRGSYDLVYAGATSARYAALQSGSADAAMLNPPTSFLAMSQGFTNLGFVNDFAPDLPFTGTVVATAWAGKHKAQVRGFVDGFTEAVAWFDDPKNRGKASADLIAHTRQKPADVDLTYEFFHKIGYFEPTGKVQLKLLSNIAKALQAQGALDPGFDVHRLVMKGVTELAPE
jgi:NitT/TauT family transport system substrate-binding protein